MKHNVLLRQIKSSKVKNLLELEGKVNQTSHSVTPLMYLTIYEDFVRQDEAKKINMQITTQDILTLCEAMRISIQDKATPEEYKNYTGGKDDGKWLSIEVKNAEGVDTYILNFNKKNKKIAMFLNVYEAKSFIVILEEAYHSLCRKSDEISWISYTKELKAKMEKNRPQMPHMQR